MNQENPAAFPCPASVYNEGMSLRDYFAAQAMIGLITRWGNNANNARDAYLMADQMLERRSNKS